MDYNYNKNIDYYNPQSARYYQNFSNQGGNVSDPYSKNEHNNNLYPRNPQYENRVQNDYRPRYINDSPVNYNNNNYDGGGVYPDPRNGYSNDTHYPNIKPASPVGSAYDDSGYSNPNNISSHSDTRYKNPYVPPFNDTKTSYNTPYIPSPVKHPSSPVMPGMNPTHPPISPIPTHQVPYGGRPVDPYNDSASKGMYSSSPISSPNPGPTNNSQENPLSPTSAYSNKPFLDYDDDEKRAKPGGLMKYCCCGGRVTCCKACAIICCILVLLIIGIVAAVLLWARPPKVDFLGIVPSPNGLPAYNANPAGFDFNFGLQIQVDNPNIVGANFEMIKAIAFYPGHSDPIGGGNLTDVTIAAKRNTTIDFPFSVNYNKDIDPGFAILFDIAQKCGLTGGGEKQKLEIDYKLTLTIKILLITINPSFNRKAMIDCPIKDGKIPNIPGFDIGKAAKQIGGKRDLSTEIPKRP